MCNLLWIVVFLLGFSCSHGRAETPSESNQRVATNAASPTDNMETNALVLKLSAKAQKAAAVAIDDLIEFAKKAGDQNKATIWQARKGRPVTLGDVRAMLDVSNRMLDKSELHSAQQLYAQLQIIADSVRDDFPALGFVIQLDLAGVDEAFERYDVALHRIDDMELIVQSAGTKAPPYESIALYPMRGHLLRELGLYDKAEQVDLRFLQEANNYPEEISKDRLRVMRFELRALYADLGAFDKLAELGAAQTAEFTDEDGHVVSYRIFLMESSIVKYHLSGDRNLADAEAKCQNLIDLMKYYRGVSSTSYIQAIELMSKVKIARSRYDEAIELLKKSSELRAGLFGSDHPSVARTQAEIERVRKISVGVAAVSP